MNEMKEVDKNGLNVVMQIGLTTFTIGGFLLTAMKLPEYGLLSMLVSQVFWFYSSYRAWREARQIGIFLTTVAISCIVLWGVINYWVL